MRVAFQHTDADHPNHGVAAYALGRVQDFTHPLTGEKTGADDIVVALLDRARGEYPTESGYEVWPERLVTDVGLEDCYLCAGKGALNAVCPVCNGACEIYVEDVNHSAHDDDDPESPPDAQPCSACVVGKKATGIDPNALAVRCPNCNGAKQTGYAEWRRIDEDALRARASGEAVDVPEVGDLPARQVGASAAQQTIASQEG